jgi:cobyrinic acid a,c-diamide synthase
MTGRGLIIGAARSGAGKTSVTIGLLRAFKRRGLAINGAKSGPDYIDPGFHAAASGHGGVNLDSWAMAPDLLAGLLAEAATDRDLLIIESAMGLFDGIDGDPGRSGAAADLARLFGLPAIIVMDISGQSKTAAAIAHGFASFDPGVNIAGVILNQVASPRHHAQAADAIEAHGIKVLGSIRRNPEMALPERHLGLVQAAEHNALESFIEKLADIIEESVDLDAIKAAAAPISSAPTNAPAPRLAPGLAPRLALPPPGQRIALARDHAFSFLYPHLLRQWQAAGAEIYPFSPLGNEGPKSDCDVCWLPGGYPELHAGALAAAGQFRSAMQRFAAEKPVHGECGGFMVLGEGIEDSKGQRHQMLGLLGHETSFAKRKMNLGYRQAKLTTDCPLGHAGQMVRGHEFHYSRLISPGPDKPLVALSDGLGNLIGPAGGWRGNVSGGYFHVIARAD